ncbi:MULTISPECIES: hypothetical protein [unclassified Tolypothrix]|uniref:hypothetical protein n=1 Tax=unclassified Tolypothrix TaxID=2649714 RepID=UPI0005EAC4F0|nr:MULTISPECIES: hypothetical protein [unclassified Tolypothrix]BAY95816.1 hypothetical protein NIES3275_78930 [Microchaete diplosiphon NIES-3275]EKE98180.1 hypothetical protein FDUTEX481_04197 [Tolypothrix sp. PCC 7601]MBE9087229.1 hypothetical protein [Tolypothrix sp. LEGE 11397]UYD30801.1 hypothetical protein HGR01_38560 [Tolypothrix sp. PCC 7712]UYD38716.1 hypothetical protein HG267_39990 [Tolypothrix sp. PCC 7601]
MIKALSQNQLRRLEACSRWLREIRDSESFAQLDYHPDLTLGDAIQAVSELLQEHSPECQRRTPLAEGKGEKPIPKVGA